MPSDTRIFPNACFNPENFNQAGPHFARELANEYFLNCKLKVLAKRGTYYCKEPKIRYCQCTNCQCTYCQRKRNERDFVNSFYAKELDFEADFNDEIRMEPEEYSIEDEYDDDDYEVYSFWGFFRNFNVKISEDDIIYEEEIYDEYEEYNWRNDNGTENEDDAENEDDVENEDEDREIEDNSEVSTSEYEELRKRVSPEQQTKHFWPEGNQEKQVEWNLNLTMALKQRWPDSFSKTATQLRCPIVVSF